MPSTAQAQKLLSTSQFPERGIPAPLNSCTSDFFLYNQICYSAEQEFNPVPSPDTPAWFLALRWAHSLVLDDS